MQQTSPVSQMEVNLENSNSLEAEIMGGLGLIASCSTRGGIE
jgi:hypothetical protein